MVPAEKVITCYPHDTLATVSSKMMEHGIGSVVVMPQRSPEKKEDDYPLGIVTKTDLLRGWQEGLELQTAQAQQVMGTLIETILDTDSKDLAAEHFEKTKHRHAFVVDKHLNYVGIVGSLDIAVECAKDSKAWPYMNRDLLAAKFKVPTSPKANKVKAPGSPTCATKPPEPTSPQSPRRTFLDISGAND